MFTFILAILALTLLVRWGLKAIFYAGLEQDGSRDVVGNRKRRRARPRHRHIARRYARFR